MDLGKLHKIKTKEDCVYHVGRYQWYLAKQPLIAYYPKANVWENAYVAFFHASMTKKGTFSISSKFMVRVSTMLAANVFSEAEKHWVISTITMYGKALHRDEEV